MITAEEARKNTNDYKANLEAERAKKIAELAEAVSKSISAASKQGLTDCSVCLPIGFFEEVCNELKKVGFAISKQTGTTIIIRWD